MTNNTISAGTQCKHKLTGQTLTVKRVMDTVAVCELEEKDYVKLTPNSENSVVIKTAVCDLENLEEVKTAVPVAA